MERCVLFLPTATLHLHHLCKGVATVFGVASNRSTGRSFSAAQTTPASANDGKSAGPANAALSRSSLSRRRLTTSNELPLLHSCQFVQWPEQVAYKAASGSSWYIIVTRCATRHHLSWCIIIARIDLHLKSSHLQFETRPGFNQFTQNRAVTFSRVHSSLSGDLGSAGSRNRPQYAEALIFPIYFIFQIQLSSSFFLVKHAYIESCLV